jgi:transketolase
MNGLHKRILEISRKHNLSHLGSCLTAVDIIDGIYAKRKEDEPFILSCGHSALALFVVLEKYLGKDAEALCLKHGTHPTRNLGDGVYCSTGSLGWGLPIALGMAMADRKRLVHCLISDGEAFEGTIWETANIMHRYKVDNLKVHLNWNGWAAYHCVKRDFIERVLAIFPKIQLHETTVENYGLSGQSAHYCKL